MLVMTGRSIGQLKHGLKDMSWNFPRVSYDFSMSFYDFLCFSMLLRFLFPILQKEVTNACS